MFVKYVVKYTVLIGVEANRALFWNLGYWFGSSFVTPRQNISQLSSVLIETESTLLYSLFFSPGATQPMVGVYFTALYRILASSRTRLLDHTQRRVTVGRTPLNE